MNISNHKFRLPNSDLRLRKAFTLVELLIVLTVIGILVGLLIPAISGGMNAARRTAIRTEMIQLEQAIESFKTEYGFYPPSFEQFNRDPSAQDQAEGRNQFLAYLNRIAPNHQENSSSFAGAPAGSSRLSIWWGKVGRHLDQRTSMVFWLSGLCKSKQFPLTGGAPNLIQAFNGETATFTTPSGEQFEIERDVRFDFQPGQLVFAYANEGDLADVSSVSVDLIDDDGDSLPDLVEADEVPGGNLAAIAGYVQAHGPTNGDKLFRYRDAPSYNFLPFAYATQVPGGAGDTRNRSAGDELEPDDFVNPKTFQLISAGMDGELGVPANPMGDGDERHQQAYVLSTEAEFIKRGYDNMVNFASGPLEVYIIENAPQ